MTEPNCVELVSLFSNESEAKKNIDNIVPGIVNRLKKLKNRINQQNSLTKKICIRK